MVPLSYILCVACVARKGPAEMAGKFLKIMIARTPAALIYSSRIYQVFKFANCDGTEVALRLWVFVSYF